MPHQDVSLLCNTCQAHPQNQSGLTKSLWKARWNLSFKPRTKNTTSSGIPGSWQEYPGLFRIRRWSAAETRRPRLARSKHAPGLLPQRECCLYTSCMHKNRKQSPRCFVEYLEMPETLGDTKKVLPTFSFKMLISATKDLLYMTVSLDTGCMRSSRFTISKKRHRKTISTIQPAFCQLLEYLSFAIKSHQIDFADTLRPFLNFCWHNNSELNSEITICQNFMSCPTFYGFSSDILTRNRWFQIVTSSLKSQGALWQLTEASLQNVLRLLKISWDHKSRFHTRNLKIQKSYNLSCISIVLCHIRAPRDFCKKNKNSKTSIFGLNMAKITQNVR